MSRSIVLIPARYGSSRLEGKPLLTIGGKSIIQRVYEQALAAEEADAVAVATDDQRIFDHVQNFGGQVYLTAASHRSGTDRIAEVVQSRSEYSVVVNLQGDEPFTAPQQIDQLIRAIRQQGAEIATLARLIVQQSDIFDPHVVKVVFDRRGEALYFSRSPIPYLRDRDKNAWLDEQCFYQHLGMYAFQREILLDMTSRLPSRYEQLESLEQLRWLDYGVPIRILLTDYQGIGIDTPEDLAKARKYLLDHE